MKRGRLSILVFFLLGIGTASARPVSFECTPKMAMPMPPGQAGGGHGTMGSASYLVRLAFYEGLGSTVSELEELFRFEPGSAPISRRYQILNTEAGAEWPLGTYQAMASVGDKVVLTLLGKISGHSGHGGGGKGSAQKQSADDEPGVEASPRYEATFAYAIATFVGVLPLICDQKEQR